MRRMMCLACAAMLALAGCAKKEKEPPPKRPVAKMEMPKVVPGSPK